MIGRTTTHDPHAENYWELSPYSFLANNPFNTLDPMGMDTIPLNQVDPGKIDFEKDVILLDEVVITSGDAEPGSEESDQWEKTRHFGARLLGLEGPTDDEKEEFRRGFEERGIPLQLTGTVDGFGTAKGIKVLTNLHHSYPKFLGGLKNQKLTKMAADAHKALHKELNAFLRKYGMAPSRSNPGRLIRENSSGSQIRKVLTDFYKGPGAKYKEAADDFFKYIENITK